MASREMKGKVFERNPRKTLAAIIVILLLGLEGGSFVVLAALSAAKAEYPYNRIISGYYINKNKPNYRFNTIKADATDADARLDEHGFYAAMGLSRDWDRERIAVHARTRTWTVVAEECYRHLLRLVNAPTD